MASKRRIRRRSCEGKKPYYTIEAANRACRNLLKHKGERCNSYKCDFGNHYHVGHPLKKARVAYAHRVLGGILKMRKRIPVPTVRITETAKLPEYANEDAVGADLFSDENRIVVIGARIIIKTGLKMAIPKGCGGLIWDRSGMSYKNGLTKLAGVIDPDYRGEVGVVLHNISSEDYYIKKGDKIAQMIVDEIPKGEFYEVMELDETERGEGGFGSTGK